MLVATEQGYGDGGGDDEVLQNILIFFVDRVETYVYQRESVQQIPENRDLWFKR